MIDFHTHILPNLDDGASFWGEATSMVRAATSEGTEAILLTPHFSEIQYRNTRKRILQKFTEFKAKLSAGGIQAPLYPASEVRLEPTLLKRLMAGEILTINDGNKYLLVELPFLSIPPETDEILDALIRMNIIPILAHPERNLQILKNPTWLEKAVAKGTLIQLNAGSLTGDLGPEVTQCAVKLAKLGFVHFLGSDAHSLFNRSPDMNKAVHALRQLLSPAVVRRIILDNPTAALEGEKIKT